LKIISSIIVSCLIFLTIIFYLVNFGENSTVLKYWEQPQSVDFGKYKYRLSIVEVKSKLQFFKIGKKQNKYKIVISKNRTKPEVLFMFGHYKLYSFAEFNKYSSHWKELDIMLYIKKCTVEWSKKGIVFIEPSGHELFFPVKVYQ